MVTFFSDRSKWLVVALLAVQVGLLVHSAKVHSPTWDEVGHLAAGISHWKLGRFELYSVNPPLVRTLAAAPVVAFSEPKMDWDFYRSDPTLRSEVYLGRRMIELNGSESLHHFFLARLAIIPIALLGGWLCFLFARDLFGVTSGLIALTLWTFSPNVLAYGSVITPDLGSVVALLGACYVFWRWLKVLAWSWAMALAAALAYAMLIKSVWLILPLVFLVIWVAQIRFVRMPEAAETRGSAIKPAIQLSQGLLATLLAVLAVNGFYGFHNTLKPLQEFKFVSSSLVGESSIVADPDCEDCPPSMKDLSGNRFAESIWGRIPVPLPANYLQGIDIQARDFEHGRYDSGWMSYLFGEWQQGGWWYYYIVGLFLKVPLATWMLLAIGSIVGIFWRPDSSAKMGVACLWVPAIVFFVIVSAGTGLNRYVRYALPVLPVLFIWASQAGRLSEFVSDKERRLVRWIPSVLCLWLVFVSLRNTPHHLSYFNEVAGGPALGHRMLCDSNIDWGQDLILLERWLEQHPEATQDLRLAYFGAFDPASLGIQFQLPQPLPDDASSQLPDQQRWLGPTPGWHVLSKNYIVGHSMPIPTGNQSMKFKFFPLGAFQYFSELEPTASIGNSMLVYHLDLAKANELRRQYHLAPLQHRQATPALNTAAMHDSKLKLHLEVSPNVSVQ